MSNMTSDKISHDAQPASRWGRTSSGRSPLPGAVAIGVLVSGGIALAGALLQHDALFGVLLLAATAAPACLVGWVLVVDRTTIPGTPRHPEQAVEASWYGRATREAFHDLIAVLGLGLLALSIVPALRDVSASTVLSVVLAVATADVAVRYLRLKHRES